MDEGHVTSAAPKDASPDQLRAARAMLDWSLVDVSSRAHVSISTVLDLERGRRGRQRGDAIARVVAVFETVGITFLSLPDGTEVLTRRPEQTPAPPSIDRRS